MANDIGTPDLSSRCTCATEAICHLHDGGPQFDHMWMEQAYHYIKKLEKAADEDFRLTPEERLKEIEALAEKQQDELFKQYDKLEGPSGGWLHKPRTDWEIFLHSKLSDLHMMIMYEELPYEETNPERLPYRMSDVIDVVEKISRLIESSDISLEEGFAQVRAACDKHLVPALHTDQVENSPDST